MATQISMIELHKVLEKLGKNELILDVRGIEEFKSAHIRGSRNIPHDQVEKYKDELQKYDRVYIHCHAGVRAQIATQTLEKLGLNNLICVAGSGMKDWLAAGYPVVK